MWNNQHQWERSHKYTKKHQTDLQLYHPEYSMVNEHFINKCHWYSLTKTALAIKTKLHRKLMHKQLPGKPNLEGHHQTPNLIPPPQKKVLVSCIQYACLTLILLMWRIQWAPNNASKWQMGFNSAFKGLNIITIFVLKTPQKTE